MKKEFILGMVVTGALLLDCATVKSQSVPAPAEPVQAQTAKVKSTDGILVVYSAYEVNADFNSRDPYRPECSDYKILTADGKLLKRVHNVTDDVLQNPVPVGLPEGKYQIVARANGHGVVTIPLIIKPGENAILHLEGGSDPGLEQTHAIHLPDGKIVGWGTGPGL